MRFIVGENSSQSLNETKSELSVFEVTGEKAVNLSVLDSSIGSDLTGLMGREDINGFVSKLKDRGTSLPLDTIVPALPVARPGKVICLGLNYPDHIKEGDYQVPDYPALCMRGTTSLMPAGETMICAGFPT